MSEEPKDLQNKIKYSIWNTRIDESQLEVIEKSPEHREELSQKKSERED